jgi:hypothetical protein
MWFCDLRQMPSLRECAGELAARALRWVCDFLGPCGGRPVESRATVVGRPMSRRSNGLRAAGRPAV